MATIKNTLWTLAILSVAGFFTGAILAGVDDPAWVNPVANYMMVPGTIFGALVLGPLIASSRRTNLGYRH